MINPMTFDVKYSNNIDKYLSWSRDDASINDAILSSRTGSAMESFMNYETVGRGSNPLILFEFDAKIVQTVEDITHGSIFINTMRGYIAGRYFEISDESIPNVKLDMTAVDFRGVLILNAVGFLSETSPIDQSIVIGPLDLYPNGLGQNTGRPAINDEFRDLLDRRGSASISASVFVYYQPQPSISEYTGLEIPIYASSENLPVINSLPLDGDSLTYSPNPYCPRVNQTPDVVFNTKFDVAYPYPEFETSSGLTPRLANVGNHEWSLATLSINNSMIDTEPDDFITDANVTYPSGSRVEPKGARASSYDLYGRSITGTNVSKAPTNYFGLVKPDLVVGEDWNPTLKEFDDVIDNIRWTSASSYLLTPDWEGVVNFINPGIVKHELHPEDGSFDNLELTSPPSAYEFERYSNYADTQWSIDLLGDSKFDDFDVTVTDITSVPLSESGQLLQMTNLLQMGKYPFRFLDYILVTYNVSSPLTTFVCDVTSNGEVIDSYDTISVQKTIVDRKLVIPITNITYYNQLSNGVLSSEPVRDFAGLLTALDDSSITLGDFMSQFIKPVAIGDVCYTIAQSSLKPVWDDVKSKIQDRVYKNSGSKVLIQVNGKGFQQEKAMLQ